MIEQLFGATLLFKSSFEKGVYLETPKRNSTPIWWQEIKGKDNSNFSWPIKLQDGSGTFQMITNDANISAYIENSLEEVEGINRTKSRVLHQTIKKKEHEYSQDPYVIYTKDREQKQLYIRYSLKFPANLANILGRDGWLVFSEYKTASDYRLAFYIYCNREKSLYWYAHGDNVVLDDRPYKEYWSRESHESVKAGEWMDIEIFWSRSKKDDGRVWLAVDGKVIIDYRGATKLKEPIHEIMLFTNYASTPIEQWIDNIEIWDNFPCGEGKSCHKN